MSRLYDEKSDYMYHGIWATHPVPENCPFCGFEQSRIWQRRHDKKFIIKCHSNHCGIEGPPRTGIVSAKKAWNKRFKKGRK